MGERIHEAVLEKRVMEGIISPRERLARLKSLDVSWVGQDSGSTVATQGHHGNRAWD